ncbi:nicotinamidase [Xanthocytophaga agilis]|uniref:Nicotinamidase n=1 Tax=Xanthocytophaga agilis TaxID=3048010 RepID=A0AAE3RB36_9BACT|nr:nicotinamidase [Xanthocytophaga agilis]MDJ1504694.1 nicotinamidase [Xanthocytophaga agilis]
MKTAFLIIDAQYDFCNPNGALYVPGAEEDIQRLSHLITTHSDKIDAIYATLDTHPVNDISHPSFWISSEGQEPAPFTLIKAEDVKSGKWKPRFNSEQVLNYLEKLELQGEFIHCIWPEHCLHGSRGAALEDSLLEALRYFAHTGKEYHTIEKGTNPMTEHFGIFKAQIPIDDAPETQLNTKLIDELLAYDQIFLCGEAKSHCVATSLKQVLQSAPELAKKFVIIDDIMSDVTGFGYLGDPIYAEARKAGIPFMKSSEITL